MPAVQERDDTLLTLGEVAERLRISDEQARVMYHRGELAGVKVGRCVRIFADAVQAILDAGRRRVAK